MYLIVVSHCCDRFLWQANIGHSTSSNIASVNNCDAVSLGSDKPGETLPVKQFGRLSAKQRR